MNIYYQIKYIIKPYECPKCCERQYLIEPKIVYIVDLAFYYVSEKHFKYSHLFNMGAQWLSGRVLDSRPKGRGFEPHRRHCVVVLEQDTFILA